MKRIKLSKVEFSKRMTVLNNVAMLVALFIIILFRVELQNLAIAIVTEMISVTSGYFVKAYLGKKNEESNKLSERRYTYYFDDTTTTTNADEGEY